MKKNLKAMAALALSLIMALPAAPAKTAEAAAEGEFEYTIEDGGATITKYNNSTGHLVDSLAIPDQLGGCPVTAIGADAFQSGSTKKIVIPDSVTSIGERAFSKSSLAEIEIPAGVTSIAPDAFVSCFSLKELEVSPDNPNYTSTDNVLFSKDKTELIACAAGSHAGIYVVPDGVTDIQEAAFYDCLSLTSIILPGSVKHTGRHSFYHTSLTSLVIPAGTEQVGDASFEGVHSLKDVYYMGSAPEHENGYDSMEAAPFTIHYLTGTEGWDQVDWHSHAHEECERFFKKGAVTQNEKVTLNDAQAVLKYALKISAPDSPLQYLAADTDEDLSITLQDAQTVLKMALLIVSD